MDDRDRRPRSTIVAGLLIRDERILLCHRHPVTTEAGRWDLPKTVVDGSTDFVEALASALLRSLGIHLREVDAPPVGTLEIRRRPDEPATPLTAWLVRDWRGDPVERTGFDHDHLGWFAAHEMVQLDLAHPAYPSLFSAALDRPGPTTTILRRIPPQRRRRPARHTPLGLR